MDLNLYDPVFLLSQVALTESLFDMVRFGFIGADDLVSDVKSVPLSFIGYLWRES